MIQLFVSDMDGTLLDENHELPQETIELIQNLRAQGYHFGVATGRPKMSAHTVYPHLDTLLDFAIYDNGAEVHLFKTNTIIRNHWLSGEVVREIVTLARKHHLCTMVSVGDTLYSDPTNAFYGMKTNHITFGNVLDVIGEAHPKVVIRGEAKELEAFRVELMSLKHLNIDAFKSAANLLEVMDPAINKFVGLNYYLTENNIKAEHVMSFGDNDNDIPMIQNSGLGVAMENATEGVKAVCKDHTIHHSKNGVHHYITSYLKNID